jgi:ubiquinone/menaquinone biosynthesis C-methylase UbiE
MTGDRFEGLYGRVYNTVIQTPALRRGIFTLWGSADPLLHLDAIVAAAAAEAGEGAILDVPCGGGTVLALLQRAGFGGSVIETDRAAAMLHRARAAHRRLAPDYAVEFLQADARALPLETASVDVGLSINGLHVIPQPERFLAELARVIRPGGALWLITPVSSPALRSRAILKLARMLEIIPGAPPTLAELHAMVPAAGLHVRRSLGGRSITGLVCDRP